MNLFVFRAKKRHLTLSIAAVCLLLSDGALAQEDTGTPPPDSPAIVPTTGRIFTLVDFQRFGPRNALDMLEQVPGFSIQGGDQGRGLGQANTNVLVNGQRISSKSQDVWDQLRRVNAENVERIEIVDGATLEIPGLSGQVANVVTRGGDISGRYQYRTIHRPKYAKPAWFSGEVSVSGSSTDLEWSAAYNHGTGRGAAGGPALITDEAGNITENRNILLQFTGEYPRLSGSMKWTSPNGMIANLNAQYSRSYQKNVTDEDRDLVNGVDQFRDFGTRGRGHGYEIGGDIDFEFGPGRLKLIGLDSSRNNYNRADAKLIYADGSTTTGNRFVSESESSERIVRSEYRWDMLGGNWQLDAEAAYNKLDQASELYNLDPAGVFVAIPLPNSTGQVTEDRYEMIITHGRTLAEGLSMQLGIGGENSTLAQTGSDGLVREFWRPKGSLSLAWTPQEGLDLSLTFARRVGQLSFGQFLANVNLEKNNADAGNNLLKPTLRWESELEIKKNLDKWGSATVKLYGRWYDDYIDVIPLPGGGESPGNIDSAQLYGLSWKTTINLDPLGWEGAKIDFNYSLETSSIRDPLIGESRSFSGHYYRNGEISLRHDIVGTNWVWGVGIQDTHVKPAYRLSEVSLGYEGPNYTFGFIENKDFFGLTANFQVFNMTSGSFKYHRVVYDGPRDSSGILFIEDQNLSVQPIFRFQVTGNF